MNNPFKFFDKIYYINLDRRTDRREIVLKTFISMGLVNLVTRIPGEVSIKFNSRDRNACYGNHTSHAVCMEAAHILNAENVLIFEDDVDFFYDKNTTYEFLSKAIEELPKNWDMLYLGINLDRWKAYQISEHLAKLEGGFSTHAYAVNKSLFKELYDINMDESVIHNDVYYAEHIHNKYNCYVTIPLLCGQRTDYSDIEGRIMDSNSMFKERFEKGLIRL